MDKCHACGVNPWDVLVCGAQQVLNFNHGHRVCFTCIAEFVRETDATMEAFEWWIDKEREGERRPGPEPRWRSILLRGREGRGNVE